MSEKKCCPLFVAAVLGGHSAAQVMNIEAGTAPYIGYTACRGEACQWWWSCREPKRGPSSPRSNPSCGPDLLTVEDPTLLVQF